MRALRVYKFIYKNNVPLAKGTLSFRTIELGKILLKYTIK